MELKNNQGVLFKNEKTKDLQPDFTGEINVEGNVMRIALWKKQSSKGTEYMSVQVSAPQAEKHNDTKDVKQSKSYDDLDDAIPF